MNRPKNELSCTRRFTEPSIVMFVLAGPRVGVPGMYAGARAGKYALGRDAAAGPTMLVRTALSQTVDISRDALVAYTDGSLVQGGRGGVAFVARDIRSPEFQHGWSASVDLHLDINALELAAIYAALCLLDPESNVIVHTDSETALKHLVAHGYKRHAKFAGLAASIEAEVVRRPGTVVFSKIRSKKGGNAAADALARLAAAGRADAHFCSVTHLFRSLKSH